MAFPNHRGCELENRVEDLSEQINYVEDLIDKIVDLMPQREMDEMMDFIEQLREEYNEL
jgi:DNA-directed RNA polymerase subunit F